MPFTVVTLKNVPPSLRGDLTKWMQEISTGVYVGNFNSRVRQYIWKRVCDSVGAGEATISYSYHNEIGYNFETLNSGRTVVDCDGIPLVLIPVESQQMEQTVLKNGFSTAYKMHKAHAAKHDSPEASALKNGITNGKPLVKSKEKSYVILDLETTGLDAANDSILEIGAVKFNGEECSFFHEFIDIHKKIPDNIVRLTGITNSMLAGARNLPQVLNSLCEFLGNLPLVGYNISFDLQFLNVALLKNGSPEIGNEVIDLLKFVKKEHIFQSNYKLSTTLKSYGLPDAVPHRALEDAKLIFQLSRKVNVFLDALNKEG
jgi:CRISPR-associated protein Cas2